LPAVLVVSPNIRSWLSRMIRPRIPDITTLSYSEIPDDQAVKVVFTVEADANNRNN
jgi:flagellar biosynthesis protein FlhA